MITSQHPEYKAIATIWKRCRDVLSGEDAVKAAGVAYLPKLGGQDSTEYEAYKQRALFYNASARTIQAITGAVFRKPVITTPENKLLESKAQAIYEELLSVGRIGILIDAPVNGGPAYLSTYAPERIINWRYDQLGENKRLILVVLQETELTASADDDFEHVEVTQYRELGIDDTGVYYQRVWKEAANGDFAISETVYPMIKGNLITEIPFVFVGAINLDPDVDKPPILDLVNVNLSHYRSSADLEHGRHFTALPTAWVAGFNPEQELRIGSGAAWVTDNVNAKAGFLEFSGQGLAALEKALEQKEHLMAILGARLFENPKAGVEAAETLRIRQSADTATAASLANLVSEALTRVYTWMARFDTGNETNASVIINTDIIDTAMSTKDALDLISMWQKGVISLITLLTKLKEGEILPNDTDIEMEAERIKAEQSEMFERQLDAISDSDNDAQ